MHQKVLEELLLIPTLIVDDVIDQAAEKGDVGAGSYRRVDVAHRAGAREAGIDVNQLGAIGFGFHRPAKCDWMIFGHVRAHEHAAIGLGHGPVRYGRGAATEAGPQTGDAGAMSYPGLILDRDNAETAHQLLLDVVPFIVQSGST